MSWGMRMTGGLGRNLATIVLGAAAMAAVPSAASATVGDVFDTTNGSISINTSIYGNIKSQSPNIADTPEIGQIFLYGQSSTKPAGTLTTLPVWCIDITDNLSKAKFVEKPLTWATTGSGNADVTYTTAQLANVMKFLVYATGQGVSSATNSAATQLGIWEILNEKSANPTWNLGSGNFTASGYNSSSATSLANTWLTSSAFASTSTANYSLVILDASASNQMLAYLRYTAPVPEPASWTMMILGFGTIGWATRRRRAVGRAVA